MTIRAAALAIALLASVAPALAHGAEAMHSPHPEHSYSVAVSRAPVARRAAASAHR